MPRKKPFKYVLADLLSEYNQDLYNEVFANIQIKFVKQTGTWSAHIDENGDAIIGYCKSDYPDASFAHELLHIKAELNGLKDPYVRSNEKDIDWELLRFFINHLAHHRIYPEFYDLGFNENEFLNDNDFLETRTRLKNDIPLIEDIQSKLGEKIDGLAVLMPYLVCISPNENSKEIEEYKNRIIKITKPEFIKYIDDIIMEWSKSNSMDYCLTLAKLFKACGKLKISFAPQDDNTNEIKAEEVTL